MRKDIALRLREEAERVAREYSNPFRDRNPGAEVFEVDKILALSEFTAAVIFKKDSGKKAVGFFYTVKDNWRYFFPSDSHLIGMEGQHVGNYTGFGTANRFATARFLGIDVEKEWTMTEEYLTKKTRAECISLIKKFKLQKDLLFKSYVEKKFKQAIEKIDSLKKSEIIDAILKCGVNLIGKTPDEILKVKS